MIFPKIAPCRWGKLFGKASPGLPDDFWGPKRGPRRGFYSGIRIASDRARAGFLGQLKGAVAKNDFFLRAKKCEKKLRARSAAMTGAPRGASFRSRGGILASPGRALGPFWGPGEATVSRQKRKVMIFDDF